MSRRLLIGSGGCGGKLNNTILTIMDERTGIANEYDALFMNANQTEMEKLSHYRLDKNSLLIDGQGTGKKRERGKSLISDDSSKIYNKLESRIKNYNAVTIFLSADGGFGSSSIVTLSKMLKTLKNDMIIELAIAVPDKKSPALSLKNSCETYHDLQLLMTIEKDPEKYEDFMIFDDEDYAIEIPLIDSFICLDNSEIEKQQIDKNLKASIEEQEELTEDEIKRLLDPETIFNFKAMDLYLKSIDLHSGAVDPVDVLEAHKEVGYKVILPLKDGHEAIEEAIDEAIAESPFIIPNEFEKSIDGSKISCQGIVGYLDRNCYQIEDLKNVFDCQNFVKLEYLEDYEKAEGVGGFIVLTGVKPPTEYINTLKQALQTMMSENQRKDVAVDFEFDMQAPAKKTGQKKKRKAASENNVATAHDRNAARKSSASINANDGKSTLSVLELRRKMKNLKKF